MIKLQSNRSRQEAKVVRSRMAVLSTRVVVVPLVKWASLAQGLGLKGQTRSFVVEFQTDLA